MWSFGEVAPVATTIVAILEGMLIVFSWVAVHFGKDKTSKLHRYIRDRLVSNKGISRNLLHKYSDFPGSIVEIYLEEIHNRESFHIEGGRIVAANSKTNEVFGRPPKDESLIGLNGEGLLSIIRKWMNADDFLAFVEDQNRLYDDLMYDKSCRATVPIRFNGSHPRFPNARFLPIIAGYGTVEKESKPSRLLHVVYLDLDVIGPVVRSEMKLRHDN